MGRGSISGLDVALVLRQDHLKQLEGLHPAFSSPILPEPHIAGTLNQILHDPFPEEVGEGHPINLRLSVALKKRSGMWGPDKNEIALLVATEAPLPAFPGRRAPCGSWTDAPPSRSKAHAGRRLRLQYGRVEFQRHEPIECIPWDQRSYFAVTQSPPVAASPGGSV